MSRAAERRTVALTGMGAAVKTLAPAAYFVLRGDISVMQAAGSVIGAVPSATACRAVTGSTWSALWLGPDEQMLLGPLAEQSRFESALCAALGTLPHSLVDVSHRQVAFELAGPQAPAVLNAACPLDLDLAAFPVSMVTRTVFAKTEIILWRKAPAVFHVDVWRSYAEYLTALINMAAESR